MNEDITSKYQNGAYQYFKNGVLHRDKGPAVITIQGSMEWWKDGQRHREDGPAITWITGQKQWFVHNIELSEEAFHRYLDNMSLKIKLESALLPKEKTKKLKI